MNTSENVTIVQDSTGNPAPLGLLGFGMTTVLLNLHNAGFYALDSVVLAMGIFMGGLAQVIAGIQEWKKGNTFGATAFSAYGFFWLTLVGILLLPHTSFGGGFQLGGTTVAWFLLLWGIFTTGMFIGTFRLSRLLQVVFFTLSVLFFLLAIADFTGNKSLGTFAGYEGILCGLSAFYGCIALVVNELFGKKVFPV